MVGCAAAGPGAELRGQALLPDSSTGVPGILVVALDGSGAIAARTLTSETGTFLLRFPRPARYVVRALRIGYAPSALPPMDIAAGETRHADIVLRGLVVSLAGITVTSDNACRSPNDSAQLVVRLWEQARTALTATALGGVLAPLTATVRVYDRTLDASGTSTGAERSSVRRGPTRHPFASLAPDSLARVGYVAEEEDGVAYRAPDADVLISDSFAALHCLWVQAAPPDHPDWIGIGVRPAHERRDINDIAGTLWLDRATSELRAFDYVYTGLLVELAAAKAGGHVEFVRLPTAQWIVSRWSIRMPQTAIRKSVTGVGVNARVVERTVVQAIRITGGETMDVERDGVSLYHVTGTVAAAAPAASNTAPLPTAGTSRGAVVSGRVTAEHDTVGIPGVDVELVGSGMRRDADAKGQFRFVGVAEGSYDLRVRSVGYRPWVANLEPAGRPPLRFRRQAEAPSQYVDRGADRGPAGAGAGTLRGRLPTRGARAREVLHPRGHRATQPGGHEVAADQLSRRARQRSGDHLSALPGWTSRDGGRYRVGCVESGGPGLY